MKKIFTLLMGLVVLASIINAQKNVVYVAGLRADLDPGAYKEDNDVIIQMLKADPNINLTVITCDVDGIDLATNVTADLSSYDAIVHSEIFTSSGNIWKEGYPLYMPGFPKPAVYNKLYALRGSRILPLGQGTSNDTGTDFVMTVADGASGNDIFKGIDVSSGSFAVSTEGGADNGSAGSKCMQYNTGNTVTGGTMLGYPSTYTETDPATALALAYLPAGTVIDNVTLQSDVYNMNFNAGQFLYKGSDGSGSVLTNEGFTLWRNAVYLAAGLEVPSTLVDKSTFLVTSSIGGNELDAIGVLAGDGVIKVEAGVEATIYSVSGKVVATGEGEIACPAGIYIVKVGDSVTKVIVK